MKKLLSGVYSCLTGLERLFFSKFRFLRFRPRARVISVGNLSMGGTGKTPVLFELLAELSQYRLCVLSRGYRSPYERSFYHLQGLGPHPTRLTDEALLLNKRFPEIPVFLGKNRHHSAIIAEKRLQPEIMLLDDGFQYRRLEKDIDLVLIDAMAVAEEAQLIPAGRLREPVWRLNQAHAVLLTRCESASVEQRQYWLKWLECVAPAVPVIEVKTFCQGVFDAQGRQLTDLGRFVGWLAFSAIGRPAGFYSQLAAAGCNVVDRAEFRDHHHFTAAELKCLAERAAKQKLRLVCTEKDFCKIPADLARDYDICTLHIRTLPVSGKTFVEALEECGVRLGLPE